MTRPRDRIAVRVVRSTETVDLQMFAERYARAIIEVHPLEPNAETMQMTDREWDQFINAIIRLARRNGHEEGSVAPTPERAGLKMAFVPGQLLSARRADVAAIPGTPTEKAAQIYADYFRDVERMR